MKNSIKTVIILAPVLIASISIGAYYFLSKPENVNKVENNTNHNKDDDMTGSTDGIYNVEHNSSVFPRLNISDFYKNLKLNDSGISYMDKDFIAAIVNYVIDHANYGDGYIQWGYSLLNNNLCLTFKWFSGKTEHEKSYNLSLTDNN